MAGVAAQSDLTGGAAVGLGCVGEQVQQHLLNLPLVGNISLKKMLFAPKTLRSDVGYVISLNSISVVLSGEMPVLTGRRSLKSFSLPVKSGVVIHQASAKVEKRCKGGLMMQCQR